jgi:hypothetical protein
MIQSLGIQHKITSNNDISYKLYEQIIKKHVYLYQNLS